ncbi:unnamed protein product [Albugo candida]|uniref:Uncharacterized protein n=1 Tax=Albugo candida TaxID=65357 RepID=A0A024G2D1_9STRA|nr:unnamed protein product [Albugo candida]|eukprot:CCI40900.1 unnamed protein product [Albugo candida]
MSESELPTELCNEFRWALFSNDKNTSDCHEWNKETDVDLLDQVTSLNASGDRFPLGIDSKASEIQTREDSQSRMNVTNSIASPRYVRSIDRFEELAVGSPLSPPFAVRRRGEDDPNQSRESVDAERSLPELQLPPYLVRQARWGSSIEILEQKAQTDTSLEPRHTLAGERILEHAFKDSPSGKESTRSKSEEILLNVSKRSDCNQLIAEFRQVNATMLHVETSLGREDPFAGSVTQSALEEAFLDLAGSRLDASSALLGSTFTLPSTIQNRSQSAQNDGLEK